MEIGLLERHLWLEQMRATLRFVIGACGYPRAYVARESGASDAAIRALMEGGLPSPTQARLIDAWCTAGEEARGAYEQQAALSLLLVGLPPKVRIRAREHAVRYLRSRYLSLGLEVPEWIRYEVAGWLVMERTGAHTAEARKEARRYLAGLPDDESGDA